MGVYLIIHVRTNTVAAVLQGDGGLGEDLFLAMWLRSQGLTPTCPHYRASYSPVISAASLRAFA